MTLPGPGVERARPDLPRLLGAALLVLIAIPLQPLLYRGEPGSPALHLGLLASGYSNSLWLGLGLSVLVAVPFAFLGLPRWVKRTIAWLGSRIRRPGDSAFTCYLALLSGGLVVGLSWVAFGLQPALHDASAQLVDARYMADGRFAGPTLALSEFFTFQQMVNLPSGWRSQYPPGHALLLAAGMGVGAPWLVGGVLAALTSAVTYRLALALEMDLLTARIGSILVGVSPFALAQAATYMNHASAALFGTIAVLGGVLGRDSARWRLVAGAAAGITLAIRPLAGVIVASVAIIAVLSSLEGRSWRQRLSAVLTLAAGALPPTVLLGIHHLQLYGHPLTFGYSAAQGPGSGFGFQTDPWGHRYGPLEGLGQLSGDLTALGLDLFVTPLSAVMVVGLCLVLVGPRGGPWPPLLLWAFLPLVGHLFYWHQDFFLGPRLLADFHPAWALLTALSMRELLDWGRVRERAGVGSGRVRWRSALLASLLFSGIAALAVLIPSRVSGWASQWGPSTQIPLPQPPESGALVLVHGDWSERLGARLAGRGLRVDSIRAAMRHNSSCHIQQVLDHDLPLDGLNFSPREGPPLLELSLPSGTVLRTYPGEEPSPDCEVEVRSDRLGTIPLPALLWQGSLPGLPGEAPWLARDLGPRQNHRLLSAKSWPEVYVLVPTGSGRTVELLQYEEGMLLLWAHGGDSIEPAEEDG